MTDVATSMGQEKGTILPRGPPVRRGTDTLPSKPALRTLATRRDPRTIISVLRSVSLRPVLALLASRLHRQLDTTPAPVTPREALDHTATVRALRPFCATGPISTTTFQRSKAGSDSHGDNRRELSRGARHPNFSAP